MKTKTFRLISLCVLFFTTICKIIGSDHEHSPSTPSTPMPFRIGLELQEAHHVCSWALKENYSFQRQPIFELLDTNTQRRLWHVVIDGQDLEFVVSPFTRNEREVLLQAVETVKIACELLNATGYSSEDLAKALAHPDIVQLIDQGNFAENLAITLYKNQFITPNQLRNPEQSFAVWANWFRQHSTNHHSIPEEIWNRNSDDNIIAIPLSQIFKRAKMTQTSTLTFNTWLENLETRLSNEFYTLNRQPFFEKVQEKHITLPPQIDFQPQVTLQYPLEFTAPLLFGLYGYNTNADIIYILLRSLPYVWNCPKPEIDSIQTKIFSKLGGLIFLHALTISGMIPTEKTDSAQLEITKEQYNGGQGQVDAKSRLHFMSRRPFSEMWKDIISTQQNIDLVKEYALSMQKNETFKETFFTKNSTEPQWRQSVYPDYAEELYRDGQRVNLSHFIDAFNAEFLENNKDIVQYLLAQGVVSITMIRHLKHDIQCLDGKKIKPHQIFEKFFFDTVTSITHPTSHFAFNDKITAIEEKPSSYDRLSPPLFLDEEDSMGLFKDSQQYDIATYGEAIIEIRMAKNINCEGKKYFAKKLFLTNIDNLLEDIDKLFRYLYSINKENFLANDQIAAIIELIINEMRQKA